MDAQERREKRQKEKRSQGEVSSPPPPRPRLRSHRGVGTDPLELWHHLFQQRNAEEKRRESVETSVETKPFCFGPFKVQEKLWLLIIRTSPRSHSFDSTLELVSHLT